MYAHEEINDNLYAPRITGFNNTLRADAHMSPPVSFVFFYNDIRKTAALFQFLEVFPISAVNTGIIGIPRRL